MSLDQIRYFVAVAETGTTRAAALLLHVSQPPLSRQIKALEEELGARLFQRQPRGMRLLPAGELLYQRAKHILGEVARLTADVKAVQSVGGQSPAAQNTAPESQQIGVSAEGLTVERNKLLPQ